MRVTTDANTDFWRTTSYGFIRDSGQFFGTQIDGDFTAQLHIAAQYSSLYDQAGLMVRIDEKNWIKSRQNAVAWKWFFPGFPAAPRCKKTCMIQVK